MSVYIPLPAETPLACATQPRRVAVPLYGWVLVSMVEERLSSEMLNCILNF